MIGKINELMRVYENSIEMYEQEIIYQTHRMKEIEDKIEITNVNKDIHMWRMARRLCLGFLEQLGELENIFIQGKRE